MHYRKRIIFPGDGNFQNLSDLDPPKKNGIRIHVILFLATVLTTTAVGSFMSGHNPFSGFDIIYGFPFSLTLLTILGVHEFAHYFAARKWNIDVTLPYFIPAPFIPIGTFGAVIRMKSSIPNRKALVDVGASGPIAGFIVAVIASISGLYLSEVKEVISTGSEPFMTLGESLIFKFMSYLVIGPLPENFDVYLHPVAFAGWIGLFVTALNLIPVGQLDGGHVLFALSPRIHEMIRKIRIPILLLMGMTFWEGWYVWAVLSLMFGRNHPYPNRMEYSVGPVRTGFALAALIIFILCMTPTPIMVG